MYATFPVSQREFVRIFPRDSGGRAATDNARVIVQMSNGPVYPHAGKIDFVDVKVDQVTDTVAVRASLPYPDGRLIDGQLVQVSAAADAPTGMAAGWAAGAAGSAATESASDGAASATFRALAWSQDDSPGGEPVPYSGEDYTFDV